MVSRCRFVMVERWGGGEEVCERRGTRVGSETYPWERMPSTERLSRSAAPAGGGSRSRAPTALYPNILCSSPSSFIMSRRIKKCFDAPTVHHRARNRASFNPLIPLPREGHNETQRILGRAAGAGAGRGRRGELRAGPSGAAGAPRRPRRPH